MTQTDFVERAMELADKCESCWFHFCSVPGRDPREEELAAKHAEARDALRAYLTAAVQAEPVVCQEIKLTPAQRAGLTVAREVNIPGAEPVAAPLVARPGQQWKCGNEFLPYHPSASHINPDYRDGWNACYRATRDELEKVLMLLVEGKPVAAIAAIRQFGSSKEVRDV